MFGKLILVSGFVTTAINGDFSAVGVIAGSIVTFFALCVLDADRGCRTLASTIMARFMAILWAFLFVGFHWLLNHAAGRNYFTFTDTIVISFVLTVMMTMWFWLFTWFASVLVSGDPDYEQWKAAGGHHLWDTLPTTLLNPDPPHIRNGGRR